jgi:hypothetical protein
MKQMNPAQRCLMAVALTTMIAATTASAAAPALNGKLVLRPLTPGDISVYKLPSTTETSSGLKTVGVGMPLYLEAEVNSAIAPSNIVSVTWALSSRPLSSAAFLTNNPLPATVPVYEPSDKSILQVAGRSFLRADVAGQYTVTATITTTGSGSTNVTATITAGTYMGLNTCTLCHSGGIQADDMYHPWATTAHSMIFSNGINGYLGSYSASCLKCHTVGYDPNTNAIVNPVNGGFDDIMTQTGWKFPSTLAPTNWAAMPASLRNVANIQCENCHGPGSQHATSLGDTNMISKTLLSGACNQCHDAPTHHIYGTQWYTSGHANTTRTPSGSSSRWACVGCHTADGFIDRVENVGTPYTTNTMYSAIGCQTCHEPHGITVPTNNPHLLRKLGPVTMPDGTVVTDAGNGALCLQCHMVRNGSATNQLVKYPVGQLTWFGGSSFGVHDSSQGDMIEGVNAHTYGQDIPSAAHRSAVPDLCVGCHMQEAPIGDPAYLQAGGHTFNLTYNVVTTNAGVLVTNTYDKVNVCAQCHGSIPSFDMARTDYNGDGVIEGVQTEVQKLLNKLSTMLPGTNYVASGNYVADGVVKTSMSFKTNWQTKFLKAGYNWQFVNNDGSKGIHNAPFAVGILKASIADLSGDSNTDGLADSWQVQWFGNANNPLAAPNAMPSGDGVPNWMKYILGLNPLVPGVSVTNGPSVGVVWANGNGLVNPYGATNTIQIYTAAEVAFDTEQGKTYQIQAASSVSSGWQNIGYPIIGNGNSYSYTTPTRQNVQQFYRVYSY